MPNNPKKMSKPSKAVAKSHSSNGATSVWALVVVSSEGQADTLPHQRKWAEETAAAKGWRLARVVEGVATGKAGPRRIVRELMADLRALEPEARPSRLLMIRADRLGRGSIVESQIVLRDLLNLGIGVFTRDQGDVKLDTAMDELISAATLAVARHENDVRREKMLAVYRRKRAAGELVGTRAPYGLVRSNGKDVVDKNRAPVVREAFRLRLQGRGYEAIGKKLAAIAPPHVFLNGREYVVRWTATRVMLLLSNRAYVGPIVSEATFARAQRVAGVLSTTERTEKKARRYPWPLSGAMKCYCGRAMIGIACGAKPWRYRYYGCRARWNHDGKLRLVRADSLEEQFVDLLRRLRASPQLVERYRRKAAAPVSPRLLEGTLKELRTTLSQVGSRRDAAWELHVSGKIRPEDVQERLDKLGSERDDLESRISELQQQITVAQTASEHSRDVDALFQRAAQIFSKAKEPEQRTIARAVAVELGGLRVQETGHLLVGEKAEFGSGCI
jgi:DNA invertase Pin-like site-specific DNA recombinase